MLSVQFDKEYIVSGGMDCAIKVKKEKKKKMVFFAWFLLAAI